CSDTKRRGTKSNIGGDSKQDCTDNTAMIAQTAVRRIAYYRRVRVSTISEIDLLYFEGVHLLKIHLKYFVLVTSLITFSPLAFTGADSSADECEWKIKINSERRRAYVPEKLEEQSKKNIDQK